MEMEPKAFAPDPIFSELGGTSTGTHPACGVMGTFDGCPVRGIEFDGLNLVVDPTHKAMNMRVNMTRIECFFKLSENVKVLVMLNRSRI